jgi:hypothetical protein
LPKHEEQSPSRRDFLIQMFEDVYNVYNGFKPLHSRRSSEPLWKAILRARTVVHGFDDMPSVIFIYEFKVFMNSYMNMTL